MSTKKMQIIGLKGKSAYQYAQDGGYTGTEAEFKEKMAKELDAVYDYENLNEAILATAIKPEVSGEFIHITDSAALPIMDFGMEGKTEQNTTSGKNLFDIEFASDINNWDTTFSSGSSYIMSIYIGKGNTVTVSFRKQLSLGLGFILGLDTMGANITTHTIYHSTQSSMWIIPCTAQITDDNGYLRLRVGINENSTWEKFIENARDNLQIEISSTATTYEPYTGAQPSPNPDYPQEIINAGTYNEATGRYEIGCKVVNKNLFDLKAENVIAINTSSTKTSVRDIDNGIELSYTNARNSYVELNTKLLPNTTYSISCNIVVEADQTQSTGFKCINVYDNNDRYYGGNIANVSYIKGKNTFSFTTPSNTDYVKISLVGWSLVNGTTGKTTFTDFILSVDGSTEFLPHQATEFTLTSPVPLTKWDKLVKRDGVYGWSILSKECEITGSESFSGAGDSYYAGSSTNMFHAQTSMTSLAGISIDKQYIYCNELLFVPSIWSKTDGTVGLNTNGNTQIHMRLPNTLLGVSDDATVTEKQTAYRNYLRQRHAAGNPLKLLYKVDTEQSFHPLPDSEQELLKSIETYYQVTNIYNDQNCPMSIQYVADTQTYIDNLTMSLTNAVVSLGGEV